MSNQAVRSTTASGVGGAAVYETRKAVEEYLQFHYATDAEFMPYACGPSEALGFTRRMAAKCSAASNKERALDIGCSVGGASFELCREFDQVVGIDFSQAFVDAAEAMIPAGEQPYNTTLQASVTEERTARVDPTVDRTRASFMQGDACALPGDLGTFDAVLAGNLLCRPPLPQRVSAIPSHNPSRNILTLSQATGSNCLPDALQGWALIWPTLVRARTRTLNPDAGLP